MKVVLILAALLCAGCDNGADGMSPYAAPAQYTCTVDQHDKAIKETEQAKVTTKSDSPAWLYGAALMRNCERIKP